MTKYSHTRNQELLVQNLWRYLFVPWAHRTKTNSLGLSFGPWKVQAVPHSQIHAKCTSQTEVSGPMETRPGVRPRILSVDSQQTLFRWSYDSNKDKPKIFALLSFSLKWTLRSWRRGLGVVSRGSLLSHISYYFYLSADSFTGWLGVSSSYSFL